MSGRAESIESLSYALITPARNEEQNIARLAGCVLDQTQRPETWLIVDNGSSDGTAGVAERLASEHVWIGVLTIPGGEEQIRGAPVVRALHAGLEALTPWPEVVVKVDADVSFERDHFERLLAHFDADATLGIAGSLCLEEERGRWQPRYSTRSHVRGAVRAYRRACLEDVLPLEERMGWDGIDEIKAAVHGWRTATFRDVSFFHHRSLGEREGAGARWARQGEMAYFMGYRPSYLGFRALYRGLGEPAALTMVWGYVRAAFRRTPRYADPEVRAWLRREQSLRRLPLRMREALGRDRPQA